MRNDVLDKVQAGPSRGESSHLEQAPLSGSSATAQEDLNCLCCEVLWHRGNMSRLMIARASHAPWGYVAMGLTRQ